MLCSWISPDSLDYLDPESVGGIVAGATVGWIIDEFGDVIIDWVVGWFN